MDFSAELNALKTVTEALQSLEPDARQRVLDYVCKALGLEPSAVKLKSAGAPPLEHRQKEDNGRKPASPQEYLRKYSFKTMTKKIGVLAVFLERERNRQRFTLREITEAFRNAKEPKTPASSQFIRAVAMNYLAKEGDSYYATSAAEALVDEYQNAAAGESDSEE